MPLWRASGGRAQKDRLDLSLLGSVVLDEGEALAIEVESAKAQGADLAPQSNVSRPSLRLSKSYATLTECSRNFGIRRISGPVVGGALI
jgi:hypothetical protein